MLSEGLSPSAMTRINVEIELPDTLATQAKKAGLLEPEALQRMLREALLAMRIGDRAQEGGLGQGGGWLGGHPAPAYDARGDPGPDRRLPRRSPSCGSSLTRTRQSRPSSGAAPPES